MQNDPKATGAVGGLARAKKLTPEERKAIAMAAAEARWANHPDRSPRAVAEGTLDIHGIKIPCAVLEDGTRVLSRTEFIRAIGRKGKAKGGRRYDLGFQLPVFLTADNLKQFITNELMQNSKPIPYRRVQGGGAIGYRAELLSHVCNLFLDAKDKGVLRANQEHIAKQCKLLNRGFAIVGLTALIDEATGFQEMRGRRELQEILEKFISKELRKWVRRFPFEFYEKIFHLKGWDTSDLTPNSPKPLEVGRITDDLVYKRLAPAVRAELRKLTPRNEKGYLVNKLHQHLTDDIGSPKLEKHIDVLMALMDVSPDWPTFMANVDKVRPRFGANYELPLGDSRRVPDAQRPIALLPSSATASSEQEQGENPLPSAG
jgi:hypothetical protein